MKQGLLLCSHIKITRFLHIDQVGCKTRARHDVLAEFFEFVRVERNPAESKTAQHYGQQGWKDSFDPSGIEGLENRGIQAWLADQDQADQVAGNDKEDVNANQAAVQRFRKEVVNNDAYHRQRPQSVDVWPILIDRGCRRLAFAITPGS